MSKLPLSELPVLDEESATGEVRDVFDDVRRTLEIPFVPNIHRAAAGAPNVLSATWAALSKAFLSTSLPMPLASMILFSISAARNCEYCSAVHQITCKNLGVEEDTLAIINSDLDGLTPRRVQAIIKFAQKCAFDPQSLGADAFADIRGEGITDQEIVEIIGLAALGNYLDTLADSMKIEVDDIFTEILGGRS